MNECKCGNSIFVRGLYERSTVGGTADFNLAIGT
jgi:hypothetical protein